MDINFGQLNNIINIFTNIQETLYLIVIFLQKDLIEIFEVLIIFSSIFNKYCNKIKNKEKF